MNRVVDIIRENYAQLTPSKKKVASYFLNNYSTAYLDTLSELADKIGVSDTTIINYCNDMGYFGYNGFKKALKEEQKTNILAEATDTAGADAPLLREIAGQLCTNITKTLTDSENIRSIEDAVKMLSDASKIYTVGFWTWAAVAREMEVRLMYKGYLAEAIFPDLGDYIDHLFWAGKDDVALVYDFSNYTTALTEICSVLKEREVPIILITDNGPCPRLSMADIVIRCSNQTYFSESTSNSPIAEAVNEAITAQLFRLYPRKRDDYNKESRKLAFTQFNPYGVYEKRI